MVFKGRKMKYHVEKYQSFTLIKEYRHNQLIINKIYKNKNFIHFSYKIGIFKYVLKRNLGKVRVK